MNKHISVETISELITFLDKVKAEHGDIKVCHSEQHEYWGTYDSYFIPGFNLSVCENAQPQGPKSGKSVKARVNRKHPPAFNFR